MCACVFIRSVFLAQRVNVYLSKQDENKSKKGLGEIYEVRVSSRN